MVSLWVSQTQKKLLQALERLKWCRATDKAGAGQFVNRVLQGQQGSPQEDWSQVESLPGTGGEWPIYSSLNQRHHWPSNGGEKSFILTCWQNLGNAGKPQGVWTMRLCKVFTISNYFYFQGWIHKFWATRRDNAFIAFKLQQEKHWKCFCFVLLPKSHNLNWNYFSSLQIL